MTFQRSFWSHLAVLWLASSKTVWLKTGSVWMLTCWRWWYYHDLNILLHVPEAPPAPWLCRSPPPHSGPGRPSSRWRRSCPRGTVPCPWRLCFLVSRVMPRGPASAPFRSSRLCRPCISWSEIARKSRKVSFFHKTTYLKRWDKRVKKENKRGNKVLNSLLSPYLSTSIIILFHLIFIS